MFVISGSTQSYVPLLCHVRTDTRFHSLILIGGHRPRDATPDFAGIGPSYEPETSGPPDSANGMTGVHTGAYENSRPNRYERIRHG